MAVKVNEANPKKNALSHSSHTNCGCKHGRIDVLVTQNTEFQKTVSVVMWDAPVGI